MSGTTPVPLLQSDFYKQRAVNKIYARTPPSIGEATPATPPTVLPVKETDYDILHKGFITSFPPQQKEISLEHWYDDFKSYLGRLLERSVTKEELRQLTLPENKKLWMTSFTHDSFNPTKGENYQIMEKYGDSIMKVAFTRYLLQHFSNLDESEISNLSSYYLSKRQQGDISRKLGLPNFLLSHVEETLSINEDLLEAFFGTLYTVANKYNNKGAEVAYRFLETLYKLYPINLIHVGGHPKSQVTQAIKGLDWGDLLQKDETGRFLYVSEDKHGAKVDVVLYFPEKAVRYFKANNIKFESRILATGQGNTPKVASYEAYTNALQKLSNYHGVNYIKMSKEQRVKNVEVAELLTEAGRVAKEMGYDEIRLHNSVRDTETSVFLHGVRGDKIDMLYGARGSNEFHKPIQMKLLSDFIASRKKK